jgi:RNA polymerase sigma-70 factor (ECF subfamily)
LPAGAGPFTIRTTPVPVAQHAQRRAVITSSNHHSNDDPNYLLARWRQGDQQAAADLFRRYQDRLIALARKRLSPHLSQRLDAEDVVQSACRSFFADARAGRYDPQEGSDIWRILVTITLHKLQHQVQRHTAQKRAVKREQGFGSEDSLLGLQAEVLGREPAPVEAVALIDELEQVMRGLAPVQRRILELRLQGHLLEDIVAATRCSQRTVRRHLEKIKEELEKRRGGPP